MPGQLAQGQTSPRIRDVNANMWWIYVGDHPFKGKWGLHSEVNARRANFGASWQQLLLREAVTYRFSKNVQVAAGYGSIRNARYGDFPIAEPNFEHRVWEQVTLKHELKRLELEHRYRLEQRFIQSALPGNGYFWRYQDRFRYQMRAAFPVSKNWYVLGADELFIHFGPNHGSSPFDQNRAIAGVGSRITPTNRLEFHYLNQFVLQRNGRIEESNHTFRVQWSSSTPLARFFSRP